MTVEKRYPTAEDAIRGKREELLQLDFVEILKDLFVSLPSYTSTRDFPLIGHVCNVKEKENSGGFIANDPIVRKSKDGMICNGCGTKWGKDILKRAKMVRAMKEFNRGKMGKDRT